MQAIVISIPRESSGGRLDQFLTGCAPHLSRSRIQSLIKEGRVLLNGAATRPSAKIRTGDEVSLEEPAPEPVEMEAEEIPIAVLYEDEDLLVINKEAGMVVHPGAGNRTHTLVNALLHHCGSLSSIGGEMRPGIVHRLDKETSGCLVVAKSDAAHRGLSRQFASREVRKTYLAVAAGKLARREGWIEVPIGRHAVQRKKMAVVGEGRGRAAKTGYRVVKQLPAGTLVECALLTGRTHQIRVHLKHIGHPVLGDPVYGSKRRGEAPRLMLHAWKLGFTHPVTAKWLEIMAPIPDDFRKIGARE